MLLVTLIFFIIFTTNVIFEKGVCDDRGPRVRRIVGGGPAAVPPEDDPVVYTKFAGKTARVEGVREYPHYVFKGLRYAHPPVKKERFLRPRELFLEGIINATQFQPPCIQPVPGHDIVIGKEDCLFLNIFTPDLPTGTEGYPVVIWIHGGGFRYGSASQYGVRHLVGKRLVVVTIQYRLGSLGFLSTGTKHLPGNAALWDMALATQWVRNYIGFFGGNPHRIVVMGHGTGASSALLVALSNIAKGSIHGVIAMSGTAISNWAVDNTPSETAREIAEENGCPITNPITMVKCLQNVPADSVIKRDSYIEFQRLQSRGFVSGLSGKLGSSPCTEGYNDGRSLPGLVEGEPLSDLYNNRNPQIPLLTGITRDETKKAVEGQYKSEIVSKLTSIPNFLDKILVKNLQSLIGLDKLSGKADSTEKLGSLIDPLGFRNYIEVKKNNINEGLAKISEVTGDALFNVPAFLTADLWSKKGAPTFLYRFEHSGNRKKGDVFLKGMPLVGNSSTDDLNDTVAHGDDLSYIFDAHDIEGRPLPEDSLPSQDDQKVREIFTQMISDFARHGKITVNNQDLPPFSSKANNFVQIRPKPVISDNFRFCQMALWCGIAERLKSTACQFLDVLGNQLKGVQTALFDTVNVGSGQLNKFGNIGGMKDNSKNSLNNVQSQLDKSVNTLTDTLGLFNSKKNEKLNLGFLG